MKIQITENDLEWTLSYHKKFPRSIYATKTTTTPFVQEGTIITKGVIRKINEIVERSGRPFIEVESEDDFQELLSKCYKPKDDEAKKLLKNARGSISDIFYEEITYISKVAYEDLEKFFDRYYRLIKTDSLLRESIVTVMDFKKEKFSHITNDFFLATLFIDYCNETGVGEFNIDHLWIGILLHDVGKPKHHFSYKISDKETYEFQYVNFEEIKVHPQRGSNILLHENSVEIPKQSIQIVYRHHQRTKGGYPDLKKGEIIPPYVHLFTMPDMYEQMQVKEENGKKWTKEMVLKKLEVDSINGEINRPMWEAYKGFLLRYDRNIGSIM